MRNMFDYRVWYEDHTKMYQVKAIDWLTDGEVISCHTLDKKLYFGLDIFTHDLMQFTGQHDCANNKIYEGDIMYNESYLPLIGDMSAHYIVYWNNENAAFHAREIGGNDDRPMIYLSNLSKVVDNVFENKLGFMNQSFVRA